VIKEGDMSTMDHKPDRYVTTIPASRDTIRELYTDVSWTGSTFTLTRMER